MDKLLANLWILFAIYMMVLLAILADLWSGVRKAQRRGVARSSYGYKRTIDKIARYYNVLIALSIVDAMQIVSIWYLETYYAGFVPMFPFVTLLGAVGIGLIEIKSIFEKAEDKVKVDDLLNLTGKVLTNKTNIELIAKSVSEYLQTHEAKPKPKPSAEAQDSTQA